MRFLSGAILWLAIVMGAVAQTNQGGHSLVGTVSIKGNEPFVYVALTEESGTVWKLEGALSEDLFDHQGETVSLWVANQEIPAQGPFPKAVQVLELR